MHLGPPVQTCQISSPRRRGYDGAGRNVEPCESVARRLAVLLFVAFRIGTMNCISSGVGRSAARFGIAPTCSTIPNAAAELSTALTQCAQLRCASRNVRLELRDPQELRPLSRVSFAGTFRAVRFGSKSVGERR